MRSLRGFPKLGGRGLRVKGITEWNVDESLIYDADHPSQPAHFMAHQLSIDHVLLADWNGACYLDEAIRSVVQQTLHDWVRLSVGVGSTDGSRDIISRWAAPRASYCKPFTKLLVPPLHEREPSTNLATLSGFSQYASAALFHTGLVGSILLLCRHLPKGKGAR